MSKIVKMLFLICRRAGDNLSLLVISIDVLEVAVWGIFAPDLAEEWILQLWSVIRWQELGSISIRFRCLFCIVFSWCSEMCSKLWSRLINWLTAWTFWSSLWSWLYTRWWWFWVYLTVTMDSSKNILIEDAGVLGAQPLVE